MRRLQSGLLTGMLLAVGCKQGWDKCQAAADEDEGFQQTRRLPHGGASPGNVSCLTELFSHNPRLWASDPNSLKVRNGTYK